MQKWSLKKALFYLFGSTALTLTLSLWGYFHWKEIQRARILNPKYHLTSIIQTGPEKEPLKTEYLAEVLGLSRDKPLSLYAFNLQKAEKALLASPLIAHAKLKKLPPSTLYIEYEARHPIALLADYENIAIDKEGYLFPFSPFFSPRDLPEIYLGLPPFGDPPDRNGRAGGAWQTPLQNRYLSLALEILQSFEGSPWKENLLVKRVDVSNAFAPTLGQREAVLLTEETLLFKRGDAEILCTFPKILRLMPKDYTEPLSHFFALRKTMAADYQKQIVQIPESGRFAPRIIDLRIPHLAFVENH